MSLTFEEMEEARVRVNEELGIESRIHRLNDNEIVFINSDQQTVARLVRNDAGLELEFV